MRKYENQEEIACKRNSYSKMDNDATFMRMKEDHMRNAHNIAKMAVVPL